MFYFKDVFSKCDQIVSPRKLQIWSRLLKKFLLESFIFLCSVIGLNLRSVPFHAHSYFVQCKVVKFLIHAKFRSCNMANDKITVLVLFLYVTMPYHLDMLFLMIIISGFHHML